MLCRDWKIMIVFFSDQNVVQEKAHGVGGWGGTCRCSDGNTYKVGDNNDYCKSLACVNGEMIDCNRYDGEWSRKKVTCKGNI